jgi:subtilisin family serine protease
MDAVRRYRADRSVAYAELDYVVSVRATPSDPLWSQQWDMSKISAPTAWDLQSYAPDVVVAVIDTGTDLSHPDLRANLWVGPRGEHGYTCVNGSCRNGGQDEHGHGTHVAGTIGASANNSIGMAGINWQVQLLPIRFLSSTGSGYTSDAVAAFEKVADLKRAGVNIRVTNNSWGGVGNSQALREAMLEVERLGVVNVCAAGNDELNADASPSYPAAYANGGLISVLASDRNDAGASFTNYGLGSVDIAAPGVSTLSTVPTGSCALCDGSGYKLLSGTSMAAPHVTGAVAALLQRYPTLTAEEARDALLHPSSYDVPKDEKARWTSSGGRLNLAKLLVNPFNAAPVLNAFPTVHVQETIEASGGTAIALSATASDPDGDPLRGKLDRAVASSVPGNLVGWALTRIFPKPTGSAITFAAPRVARTALVQYVASVADGRGGGATGLTHVTVLPSASGGPPSGSFSVSPASGPAGMKAVVSYSISDPERQALGWELTISSGDISYRWCCFTTSSVTVTFTKAGAYRVTVDAIDAELQQTGSRQTTIVSVGGSTGTPPIALYNVDKPSGPIPLTVNVTSQSYDPGGGRVTSYIGGDCNGIGTATCTFDTPGVYTIIGLAVDEQGLKDSVWQTVVALPASSSSSPPPPPASPPSVKITNPLDGTMVPRRSKVAVTAQAVPGALPVARVEIYVDSTLLCSTTTAPYECQWAVPAAPKQYRLDAVAVDSAGTTARSPVVRVTAK